MSKISLTSASTIITGKLDSNVATVNGIYPFFTCAPEPLLINTYQYDDDVILLAGNNAQGNFHLQRYTGKFNAYQRTYIITPKEGYDIEYLKYSIEMALNHFKKISQGSQTKFLTMGILEDFDIRKIELTQQISLTNPVKFIDKKIQNNKKIITELENMAKTIYDYWFTQFDFPDENGKPYKSSGGAMVYNEELKREIPLGWENKQLSEIAKITMGQSPEGTSYNENGDGIIFFQGSTDFGKYVPKIRMYTTNPTRFAKNEDILLSVRAPVGTINITLDDCCIGRGLAALRSKSDSQIYLWCLLKSQKLMFDRINSNGTTFGAITKDILYEMLIVKPTQSIIEKYEIQNSRSFKQILVLEKENQQLTELRDWLLPMLMNGQVTVE